MSIIKIKGHDYDVKLTKDSFGRRATKYANMITQQLRSIGVSVDDIEISEERVAMKKAPANVSWWVAEYHCNFRFNKLDRFVDNLLVVMHVVRHAVSELTSKAITTEEFIDRFKEDLDVDKQRIEARKFFDLDENHVDLEHINKQYKKLAKSLHPDMDGGDVEKFKELNNYHKLLKRELE